MAPRSQSRRVPNPRSDDAPDYPPEAQNRGSRSRSRQHPTSNSQTVAPRSRSSRSSSTTSTTVVAVQARRNMTPLSEEEIDIDAGLSDPGDESGDEPPRLRHRPRRPEVDDDAMQLDPASDPIYNTKEQEKLPTTADVRHFFEKTAENMVCTCALIAGEFISIFAHPYTNYIVVSVVGKFMIPIPSRGLE